MQSKKIFIGSLLLLAGIFLSSCSMLPSVSQDQSSEMNKLEQKNEIFQITGVLSQTPTGFIVTTPAGEIISVESYSLDFIPFDGASVILNGEYSGDTFFVTEIE